MSARYAVEGVAGRGAMSVVYRARQLGTGRRLVAYKRVPSGDPALVARLRAEAETLAELDHPNIVRIFDVVEDTEGLAIVMQYAAGGTLADVLAARGPLPPDLAVGLIATIADALASAHRRGILHRDIKPANILFTADGNPLLSDFGVARRAGVTPCTDAGGIGPGTAEYLDPAVADGATFDERSDCYALGVVAYEVLTGQRPFAGDTALAVIRAADAGDPPPLRSVAPEVPAAVADVVASAMARDRVRRPDGAADFAAALRATLLAAPAPALLPTLRGSGSPADLPGAAVPGVGVGDPPTRVFGPRPPLAPAPPPVRRLRRRVLAAIAVALVLVPPAVATLLRSPRSSPPPVAVVPSPPVSVLTAAVRTPVCDGIDIPDSRPGMRTLTGDLLGSGCRSWARLADGVLEVADPRTGRPTTFRLGEPGDQLLLGDWDGNGSATVGLYRPATGEVFRFDAWADGRTPLHSAPGEQSGITGGTAATSRDGTRDTIVVTPPVTTAA